MRAARLLFLAACAWELLLLPSGALATRGYTLNPDGNDSTRQVDPSGMSHIRKTRRRTPTGFLHPYPLEPQTLREIGDGWLAGGSIEAGGLTTFGDDDNETRFSRYSDWSQSFLVHSFDLSFLQPERGVLAEFKGGGVGRNDQYLGADVSWLGRARLRVDYSGLPRTYAKDARTLHRGLGGETLTLIPGLTPGNNSDPDLIAALTGQGTRNLSVQRDETRVQLDVWPRSDTRIIARFENQDRNGERPYGSSWLYTTGFGLSRAVELAAPVDDHTYAAEAALQFTRDTLQINVGYKGSYYRNEHDRLTWDNPFLLPGPLSPSTVERGRMALAPENDFHNFHLDLAGQLPHSGRAAFTASWSRMTQNDQMLPPTVNSGLIGGLDLDQWNTSAALNRKSANARVETLLLSGDLAFRPWKRVRVGARARYFDRDNETSYRALNPQTGEFGYVTEDGALATIGITHQAPIADPDALEDFRYRSTPYGYDEFEVEGRADITLPRHSRLGARYAWEHKGYDERERSASVEHRVRLTLSTRANEYATVRLSYRYANRDGDNYDPDPYDDDYISGLPGGPPKAAFTLNQLRKSDLANREQHEVELRWNILLREDMDLSVAGRFRADEYGSSYGLESERAGSVSADWSYAPSQNFSAHLMGSWEHLERNQRNINDSLAGIGSADGDAGGVLYPLANRWHIGSEQNSLFAGVGLTWRLLERVTLDLNYRVIHTRQRVDYDFASDGALFLVTGAQAGRRFPNLETVDHVLESSLRVQLVEHLAVRVFHRYQRGELDDFQQQGLADPTLLSGAFGSGTGVLFLGHRDRDYSAHVVGATLQLRFF
jgi:MtrB/PioB family decaheme-associated outer membrane protein